MAREERDRLEVGVVTFLDRVKNFGCALQRFALLKTLNDISYLRAEVVSYDPHYEVDRERERTRSWGKRFERKTRASFAPLKDRVRYSPRAREEREDFERLFDEFSSQKIPSSPPYSTYEEVARAAARYDLVIAGSDQVWNPSWFDGEVVPKFYLLDFAPRGKKASYAASFGVSSFSESFKARLKSSLNDYLLVSVRENEGARELSRVLERSVDVALDPTMLRTREEWDEIADEARALPTVNAPYILCYSLGNVDATLRFCRRLRGTVGVSSIVFLCAGIKDYKRVEREERDTVPILGAGPREFVALVRAARCVVTDSFHGSVFSILYHKPFFTTARDREDASRSMNSRITTLFSTFGLESRLFSPDDERLIDASELAIDYDRVAETLAERRRASLALLKDAIEKARALR